MFPKCNRLGDDGPKVNLSHFFNTLRFRDPLNADAACASADQFPSVGCDAAVVLVVGGRFMQGSAARHAV